MLLAIICFVCLAVSRILFITSIALVIAKIIFTVTYTWGFVITLFIWFIILLILSIISSVILQCKK